MLRLMEGGCCEWLMGWELVGITVGRLVRCDGKRRRSPDEKSDVEVVESGDLKTKSLREVPRGGLQNDAPTIRMSAKEQHTQDRREVSEGIANRYACARLFSESSKPR